MKTSNYGFKRWAFSAGNIPLISNGKEPAFTSHDKIAILNTSSSQAKVKITLYYEHENPLGVFEVVVKASRVRKIRFNDLIDPLPIPLEKPFGFILEADHPVIVQFSRMVTTQRNLAGFCLTPYHESI